MDAIEKVTDGDLSPAQGRSISELAARMNKAVDLEHDRVRVSIELERHAKEGGSTYKIRNIEGKNFD